MTTTVVGRVQSEREAENVARDLVSNCSCERSDITLIGQPGDAARAGSATLKGVIWGALLGGIAGYAAFAMPLPITLPPILAKVIANGPIASSIVGAFIGSVALGLIGALAGLASRGRDSDGYSSIRHPGTLITVHTRNEREADCVVTIMRRHAVMEIDKRSSDWGKLDRNNVPKPQEPVLKPDPKRSVAPTPATNGVGVKPAEPALRADPKPADPKPAAPRPAVAPAPASVTAGIAPVTGGAGLRSNRQAATALAPTLREVVMPASREGWITRTYIATYYGPERRLAANQTPFQGAERRHSA